jgi:hypothetical protein
VFFSDLKSFWPTLVVCVVFVGLVASWVIYHFLSIVDLILLLREGAVVVAVASR